MSDRTKFLLKNLLRGLIWLTLILFAFVFIKNNVDIETYEKYKHYLDNDTRVYTIYSLSELFFGILPPELFMIWALDKGDLQIYTTINILLAFISYAAGWVTYLFGRYLHSTIFYRFIRSKFLRKYERLLNTYGVYLIIVAAITPIPYSAVCMLVGSVKFPFRKFLFYTLFRFLRFMVYAFIIWETITL